MVSSELLARMRTIVFESETYARFRDGLFHGTPIEDGLQKIDEMILLAMQIVDKEKNLSGAQKKEAVLEVLDSILDSDDHLIMSTSWGASVFQFIRPHVSIWIDTVVSVKKGHISFRDGCIRGLLRSGTTCFGR